jgi:hypothetical protein
MVYGTYNYIVNGVYKPTNITGGAPPCRVSPKVACPCRFFPISALRNAPSRSRTCHWGDDHQIHQGCTCSPVLHKENTEPCFPFRFPRHQNSEDSYIPLCVCIYIGYIYIYGILHSYIMLLIFYMHIKYQNINFLLGMVVPSVILNLHIDELEELGSHSASWPFCFRGCSVPLSTKSDSVYPRRLKR